MGNMSGSYGSHYTLWQEIITGTQSITGNYTPVTINMYLTFDGSSYYAFTGNTTYGSMTVNGSTASYSIASINFSSGQAKNLLLASWSGNIEHNTDGTKSISVSGSWNTDTSRIGSGSCSASATLPTIPRASKIASFSGNNIEGNFSVQYNSYSSSFTNKLRISIPNVKALETFDYTSGTTFKLSDSTISYLYTYMANSATVPIGAVIETYSGGTKIGESSEITNTCYITNCEPTVTATLTDTNSKTTALTGDSKIMVLNASTGSLVISTTLKKSAGSIKSVTVNGTNVGSSASITKTYTPVTTSTFTIVATDSRGYSTTLKLSPTVKSYIVPTVNANFSRPSPTTGQINLQYSGNWFNGSFGSTSNTLTVSYKYKLSTASSYTDGTVTITPTASGNTYSLNETSLGKSFTYTNSYDFVLTITDKLNTITYSQRVSQGLPIIQWNKTTFQVNGDITKNGNPVLSSKSLYDNSSGTVGTVTLSETSANFTYLEIFFFNDLSGTKVYSSNKIYSPNGKYATISITENVSTVAQTSWASWLISGTSMTSARSRGIL